MEVVVMLLVGAIAGWIGSLIFTGDGLGLFGNIVVGIVGSVLGYWIFGAFGVSFGTGVIPAVLTGTLGSIVVLAVVNLLFRARSSI